MIGILFVSHSTELNGAELWLLEALRRIDRRSFSPALVVPRPGPLAEAAGEARIPVDVVPMKWWLTEPGRTWRQPAAWALNRPAVGRIARIARSRGARAILSNSAATFGGALAARKAGIPHLWSIHEILDGEAPLLRYLFGPRSLARLILGHSARVIVNSERTRAAFPPSDKIVVIPNGIEMSEGDPGRERAIREEFNLTPDVPAVGVIGKLYSGKGQREVLRAAAALRDRHPRLRVFLIGGPKDARYERELRELVRSAGMEARVHFTGRRDDLPFLLRTLSAVIVASVVESFGRAALEGMAAGVPVLAVSAGGTPEIIRHGWNGFLVGPGDPGALAEALAGILEHPGLLPEVIENGRRTVRERFSPERQISDLERTIYEVGGGAPFMASQVSPSSSKGRTP